MDITEILSGKRMSVDEMLAQIDSIRRGLGSNISSLLADPAGHFGRSAARYGEENLPTRSDMSDYRSVMPQVRSEAEQKIMNLAMGSVMPLQTVWHGSPHVFDKFDLSKIGTGEGAQAYGHGLYLAESPQVAKEYRTNLTRSAQGKMLIDGTEAKPGPDSWAAAALFSAKGDAKAVIDAIPRIAVDPTMEAWQQRIAAVGKLAGKDIKYQPPGAVYKVDLPDEHIAKMLDWDKPLSQQPQAVQDALRKTNWAPDEAVWPHYTGQQLYEGEMQAGGPYKDSGWASSDSRKAVSDKFRSAGIPGIKYLDAGSRAGPVNPIPGGYYANKRQTRNFVVFDDKILKILGRE